MRLDYVEYPELGRSMYVLYPSGDRLCCYENTLITLLREDESDALPNALLTDADFCALADKQRFVILLPNPVNGKWNWDLNADLPNDLADVPEILRLFNYQPNLNDLGIYHNMHNARYFVGVGTGASMVQTLAACNPVNVGGIFTIGGSLSAKAKAISAGAAVSAILWNAEQDSKDFFSALNEVDTQGDGFRYNSVNDAQFVRIEDGKPNELTAQTIRYGWEKLFSKVCRSNSWKYGDAGPRIVRDDYQFIVHEDDTQLGDNKGIGHTWFEYVPSSVKADPKKKVPLMIFNHGGADTPGNICNSIKMHEVAEREGFLVVYPWSTARWGWNIDLADDQYDDIGYLRALIPLYCATFGKADEIDGSGFDLASVAKENREQGLPECRFIVACGSKEFVRARIENDVRKMNEMGFDVRYLCAEGYDHDFRMWNDYIEIGLDQLLPLKRAAITPVEA